LDVIWLVIQQVNYSGAKLAAIQHSPV